MKRKINPAIINIALCLGMTLLLVTAVLPILNIKWEGLRYLFAAGAALTLMAQIATPSPSKELRVRRLCRINVWSAILYCFAAGCLFTTRPDFQKSWVAFLLAGAVIQVYATLMISKLTKNNS